MYKRVILIFMCATTLNLFGKRYAPYPVLFVHGAGSDASAAMPLFGVNKKNLKRNPFASGLGQFFDVVPNYNRYGFWNQFSADSVPYSDTAWNRMQCFASVQLPKYDTLGPYLHAFSFKEPRGSIDPDPEHGYEGQHGDIFYREGSYYV